MMRVATNLKTTTADLHVVVNMPPETLTLTAISQQIISYWERQGFSIPANWVVVVKNADHQPLDTDLAVRTATHHLLFTTFKRPNSETKG